MKQESVFYWVLNSKKGRWELLQDYDYPDPIAAFTVAELGEMLPKELKLHNLFPQLTIVYNGVIAWEVGYQEDNFQWTFVQNADTEANARALMFCYLIEKGMVKP